MSVKQLDEIYKLIKKAEKSQLEGLAYMKMATLKYEKLCQDVLKENRE